MAPVADSLFGMSPDLRPLFDERTAADVKPGLAMTPVPVQPRLILDQDALGLLRDGLGRYDMEIRWLAKLDESYVLRMWRSWTGHQIYQADVFVDDAQTHATITSLHVEQDADRYTGSVNGEPDHFESALASCINTLRQLRAGHTPYGPVDGADPLPPSWPENPENRVRPLDRFGVAE